MSTELDARLAEVAALQATLDAAKTDYAEALDTIWMLLAASLIFFMHAGFSLLEVGSVRVRSAQNILAKNLTVATVGFLCWWSVGYPFAFGVTEDPGKFGGSTNFFMDGFWESKSNFRWWWFQGTFCATAATIVSGAMAERTQLKGFIVYTIAMTAVIYPIVVYWAWSGAGFLNYTDDDGESVSIAGPAYMDFAGSGVVHMVGGVGAFCGALIVGPRQGWSIENASEYAAHNVPLSVLGTFFLWFGWFGFNPGSTGGMSDADTAHTAAIVAVNTTMAPCFAGVVVFLLRLRGGVHDVCGFCNGILAGLVAITAGCAAVKHWEACFIGLAAGFIYEGTSVLMKSSKVRIDDVVDAFAVHGANGLWGVLALGLFGDEKEGIGGNGSFYGGDQFWTQLVAAIFICLWSGVWSIVLFVPLRIFGLLRIPDSLQEKGLDSSEHSPPKAYQGGNDVERNDC
mmetsp:Transcript_89831/g.187792  ORF Transcript_89831/g.187792 Transcript_89831/m.187792 type:complete len:455 (-) Transcript_89831:33-1397(-)